MATVFYVREGAKAGKVASSREVSVEDLINLYGLEPTNYTYMKGADSPDCIRDRNTAGSTSAPAGVVVKIEANEINPETFPRDGFYIVKGAKP